MESERDIAALEHTPAAPESPSTPAAAAHEPRAGAQAPLTSPSEPTAWPRGQIPSWAQHYLGKEIGFRYRIIRPLAAGGMGAIFLGEQTNLKRRVAIKLVRSNDRQITARMQTEAESLAAVNHPAIVEVHDFIVSSEAEVAECYLVMGYVPGVDLARHLDKQGKRGLPTSEVVRLLAPVASALVELHARDIIHRDVKPSNLVRFVGADGLARCKLVDFGFARKRQDPNLTSDGIVVGTPAYLAREVIMGDGHSARSDVYALGVTLFKLLSGQNPHGSSNVAEIVRNAVHHSVCLPAAMLSTSLGELVEGMLARNPARRPTMLEVSRALTRAAAEIGEEDQGAPEEDTAAGTAAADPGDGDVDAGGKRRARKRKNRRGAAETGPTPDKGAAGPSLRTLWVMIGALSIAVAALAVLLIVSQRRSAGTSPAAGPGPSAAKAAKGAASRRAPPRRRPAPPPRAIAAIQRQCTDVATMRRMFHRARKVLLGQVRGDPVRARQVLEALLTAKCTPDDSRHWVSYYLTMAHIQAGRCAEARRTWQPYRAHQLAAQGAPPAFPPCEASTRK